MDPLVGPFNFAETENAHGAQVDERDDSNSETRQRVWGDAFFDRQGLLQRGKQSKAITFLHA
jgi:hypothetical protein